MTDKRSNPRFGPLVIKAEIDVESDHVEGYLTNVSTGGAFLALEEPPSVGTVVSIRAALPWSLGEMRASARVVWSNRPGGGAPTRGPIAGVGVAFTNLDDDSKEILDRYLARFAELAARLDDSAPVHETD